MSSLSSSTGNCLLHFQREQARHLVVEVSQSLAEMELGNRNKLAELCKR